MSYSGFCIPSRWNTTVSSILREARSDGTDGPTNAAGGYVDGDTAGELITKGIDVGQTLKDNDSYHALEAVGGLIVTGPTGTNVNDFACVLVKPEE